MEAHPPRADTILVANPSADLYGSDRMMLEGVRGLVALGRRVVVTCSVAGPLVDLLLTAGAEVRVLPIPVIRKSMLSPRGLLDLVRTSVGSIGRMRALIKDVRPDVLLVSTVTIPLWLVLARLCRVPSVIHVHEAERSLSALKRFALAAPLPLANEVVFNSQSSRSVAGLRLKERRGRVAIVHNGVSGPAHPVEPRPVLEPPIRLVYVGRLSPRKGVDLVLDAVAELRAGGIETTLDLVGAVFPGYEWYEAELREQAERLGLGEAVRFHGFQAAVWPFLAEADVTVVPSRLDESFGNVVIESLLAQRPVVVADHTGLREAASGFGAAVLVGTDDVDALAGGLRRVVQQWEEYGRRVVIDAAAAADRFGPTRFHAALADVLDRTAGR